MTCYPRYSLRALIQVYAYLLICYYIIIFLGNSMRTVNRSDILVLAKARIADN